MLYEDNKYNMLLLGLSNEFVLCVQSEHDKGNVVGVSLVDGEPIDPQLAGIFDNYSVKRQLINSG